MAHANFQVATKALIIKDGRIFTLTTPKNYVDFPGGRLDDTEYTIHFKDGLKRELSEELGDEFKYVIKDLAFVSKRDYEYFGQHHIVALFYLVDYINGEIKLSDEHEKWEWLSPEELIDRKNNFEGENEYNEVESYFKKQGYIK